VSNGRVQTVELACELTYWCRSIRSSAFCRRIESVSSISFALDCSTSLQHKFNEPYCSK